MRKAFMIMALALALQAKAHGQGQPARPGAYWFGKAMTAERSRQFFVGLHADMWVLYDLPQAVLYRAWKGGTAGGALATASVAVTPEYWFKGGPHFPHIFVPAGADHFHDPVGEYFASYTVPAHIDQYYTKWPKQPLGYKAWAVANAAGDAGAKVRQRGYRVQGTVFTLQSALTLPGGGEILVTETPEYAFAGGKHTLVRAFTFAGIPAGHQVHLLKPGGAAANWAVTSGAGTFAAGILTQPADGKTILTGTW